MPGRKIGPRHMVLNRLRAMRMTLGHLFTSWNVTATTVRETKLDEGGEFFSFVRPRRPEEYPEKQPVTWRALLLHLESLRRDVDSLQIMAHAQLEEMGQECACLVRGPHCLPR